MKRPILTLLLCAGILCVRAQEPLLPTPDAKALGMGGVTMTALSASHAIYDNAAMGLFSRDQTQLSSSYYGSADFDAYAVTGAARIGTDNLVQAGWRQHIREAGDNDMAVDLGYSRKIGGRWAVGVVGRYTHLKRPETSADAVAVDLCAAFSQPLELAGRYATLRAGARLADLGGYVGDSAYTLPTNLTAGAALDTYLSDAHEVTVGADLGYCFDPAAAQGFLLSVGAEYNLMQLVQLRAGYHYGERAAYCPSFASVGAGVRFLHLRLDFAYLFAKRDTALRNTYSFSFGLDF
ncbi:MAG: PorV/PorQ family protein [Alistipes sp.]|nr:PorV/PorQ family protein [Alistipes sp.]